MLEVREVSTYYGRIRALDKVSLRVEAGEIVCLIGANGAGKTTLLNTISGMVPAGQGEVIFDSRPITRLAPEQIVRLGLSHVPERRQVFGSLTVLENLTLGAYCRARRDGQAAIRQDMEYVFTLFPALQSRKGQLAGTLSGGEQQMLAVGRGLMARPKLMLLDEPSLGLAPLLVREIFEIIAELRRGGTTILLVEQNARAALRVADRGYVLGNGRVVMSGTAGELAADESLQRAYLGRRNHRTGRPPEADSAGTASAQAQSGQDDEGRMRMTKLLSGNEAIARGIWEAGVEIAAAYPGTPSTEILENVARYPEVYSEWSANEKVALDVAIGAAYAGKRAAATMKHVGLNVASESLFYSSYTGVNAGLVIVTADDPGLHSSQNEQDNRHYAKFAKVPMLEPSDSQEAKDMVGAALDLSEQFDTPVLLRTTTRTSHAKSLVEVRERKVVPKRPYQKNPQKYVMIPGFAKRRHPVVEERMVKLADYAETCPHNRVEMGDPSLGIVASGPSYQYAREVFPKASFLKLGLVWPLPKKLIADFASKVKRLIVVEELDPCFEEHIRLMGIPVEGKSIFPLVDEFSPEVVRKAAHAAGLVESPPVERTFEKGALPMRPPVLCAGCGHRDVFWVLRKLKVTVNSDIGCYALGVMPPLTSTDTIGCMGASIGVATGMRRGDLEGPNVAVIGDSTFFHAGMPALASAIYNQTPFTTIVVDNRTTGMTGHQGNPGSGLTLHREMHAAVDIEAVVRGMGVEEVSTVESRNLDEFETAVKKAMTCGKPAVVIAKTPCVFVTSYPREAYTVVEDDCNGCTLCFRIGCPAIYKSSVMDEKHNRPKAWIDPAACVGCGLCLDVCARQAILEGALKTEASLTTHVA